MPLSPDPTTPLLVSVLGQRVGTLASRTGVAPEIRQCADCGSIGRRDVG